MSTSEILGAVGAVVGGYLGYPQLGYAIGSAIGGAIDPQVIRGPSIGDIAKQTSLEGVPRPIVWALSPPMAGNIIASSEPRIVRKRQRQGKGGPKVETEHVYRTYAIGVCEGPITRFVRIWRNNTLVFDVSEFPQKTHEENVEFLKHARFFLGTWDQNPSPALEKIFGVGTTPSHRGTAYMVMEDEELTDLRGAIPQWMFQVERCEGFFLTSRPYAIEDTAALASALAARSSYQMSPGPEGMNSTFEAINGNLFGSVETYTNYPPEGFDSTFEAINGNIYGSLKTYGNYPPEGFDSTFEAISGNLFGDVVTYNNYPPEGFDSAFEAIDGTLGA